MANWYIAYNDGDILHFGILGMKWGIRRYQNLDGTLTSAGRRRYNNINNFKKDFSNDERTFESRKFAKERYEWEKNKSSIALTKTKEYKKARDEILEAARKVKDLNVNDEDY